MGSPPSRPWWIPALSFVMESVPHTPDYRPPEGSPKPSGGSLFVPPVFTVISPSTVSSVDSSATVQAPEGLSLPTAAYIHGQGNAINSAPTPTPKEPSR